MLMQDIILKKRNGRPLTTEEIDFFVRGYTAGTIPDYQASALLMAICFARMDMRETADLTRAIAESGAGSIGVLREGEFKCQTERSQRGVIFLLSPPNRRTCSHQRNAQRNTK